MATINKPTTQYTGRLVPHYVGTTALSTGQQPVHHRHSTRLPASQQEDSMVVNYTDSAAWNASPALLTCLIVAGAYTAGWLLGKQRGVTRFPAVDGTGILPIDIHTPTRQRLPPLYATNDSNSDDKEGQWVEKTKEEAPVTAPSNQDEFAYLKYNDPLAAASRFVGRRFGLAGGLAFVGIFAAVEGNEILQALLEPPPQEGTGEVITTESGLQYLDIKIGGGRVEPQPGYLVGAKFKVVTTDGELVYDSEGAKPLAFKYGERPLVGLICPGVEEGVRGMRVGGIRRITIPPELGFGSQPKTLRPGFVLPPNTTLIYQIEIVDIVPFYT